MEFGWYFLQILKPVIAIAVAISLPRSILPLRKGIREENQSLVNKGMVYLMIAVFGIALFIYLMVVSQFRRLRESG